MSLETISKVLQASGTLHQSACSLQKSFIYLSIPLYSADLSIVVISAHRKTIMRLVSLASIVLAFVTSTVLQSSRKLGLSLLDSALISLTNLLASYQAIATSMTRLASSD